MSWSRAARTAVLAAGLALAGAACGEPPPRDEVEVVVPDGASTRDIARILSEAGLVRFPRLFAWAARLSGQDSVLKSGRYRLAEDASWFEMLEALERGVVVTVPLTIPEGFGTRDIAARVAAFAGVPADSVLALTRAPELARELGVPGPTLEGYLFPDTYRFAESLAPRTILAAMVERYRSFWTEERRARLDSLEISERELVTLASIVEAEARVPGERPVIAGVYWNRLRRGMLLQADPTVQFALGERKERLLYRDIDSVADHPYNTYTQPGLPPGPIASPGAAALVATLEPADVPFLFFVARPDGSHVFTTTAREHVNAKNRIRAERNQR
ncbi:MAG: endolytic transglycosylase MltG [Gemmatimonadota bacterium]|nr:endolytic transglycosylase MltG [Gemmatimonadota bacterium]